MIIPITLFVVIFLGPLIYGWVGIRNSEIVESKDEAESDLRTSSPWKLIFTSALLFALAYNLTFLIQELFLVLPKAIFGLQPTLYHNNHTWAVSSPLADLMQGTGAVAILITGLVFGWLHSRKRNSGSWLQLFYLWMFYQGVVQSLPQFAGLVLNPDGDVASALNYLGVGDWTGITVAIASFTVLVLFGIRLSRSFLDFAPNPTQLRTAKLRIQFASQIVTLAALIGVLLVIPFRIPPIQQAEGPMLTFLFPLFWTLANSCRVRNGETNGIGEHRLLNLKLAGCLIILLAIFRLILAPGISF